MSSFVDLTNKKFNMLTVIKRVGVTKSRQVKWECKCECGNYTVVKTADLKNNNTKSCGCLKSKKAKQRMTIHNKSHTRIYKQWCDMKSRCYNRNNKRYSNYGGKGIDICEEWKDNFQNYYQWAMGNGYTERMTIERIDINKNYCPENCTFIPHSEQSKNRTTIRLITIDGVTRNIKEWSNITMIPYTTIQYRLNNGKFGKELIAKEVCK